MNYKQSLKKADKLAATDRGPGRLDVRVKEPDMAQLGKDWIGSSVSHGTLREQDLIPAFEGVLDSAGVEYDRPAAVDKLLLDQALTDDEQEEVGYYLNETLFDLLDEIAPAGTYFGSHPGDGSDFGFWETEESE